MNKKELNNLKFYISEKERLLKEVSELSNNIKDGYSSIDFTYTRGGKVSKDGVLNIVLHNAKYEELIKKRINRVDSIILKMYKIINKIKDPKVKTIVELRAIKGKKWEKIGETMGYTFPRCRQIYKDFIDG